jgi:hypothetical protein
MASSADGERDDEKEGGDGRGARREKEGGRTGLAC